MTDLADHIGQAAESYANLRCTANYLYRLAERARDRHEADAFRQAAACLDKKAANMREASNAGQERSVWQFFS